MYKRFHYKRESEEIRLKHRQTFLYKEDFILPLFIVEGDDVKTEIPSMPEVYHFSIDRVLLYLDKMIELGLTSVLLFGIPDKKGIKEALDGIVQKAVKAIKAKFPGLEVITDVCLCSYTENGHCHIGDNDETCKILADVALSHVKAGADIVAPSDMMDGRVYHIKNKLDENGYNDIPVMSYAAKYASNFYGPFRDAADCAPETGDRKSYQMDYCNRDEAIEEVFEDIVEGAKQIIIKPALSYLDIIRDVKDKIDLPVIGYNVSGEYKMIYESVKQGWASEDLINETIISLKRAGCDRIITYFTPYLLEKLSEQV
ncbi:MAG: porphobilinogen synthase [Spirochaetaceae bacterium]